jgi:hypothetical protein
MRKEGKRVKVRAQVSFSEEDIMNLLISALEGGSNYWYTNADYVIPSEHQEEVKEASGGCFKGYWAPFYGGHLEFGISEPCGPMPKWDGERYSDIDSEAPGTVWTIGRADLERGLQVMADKYPRSLSELLNDNSDAHTGDMYIQCVAFGEAVFG